MYYDAGTAVDAMPCQITCVVVDVFLRRAFRAGCWNLYPTSTGRNRRGTLPRQALDIGRDIFGLGPGQREIHLGVRSDQVENERFGIEAEFSPDRQERRCIRNQVVARAARYDMADCAPLLDQPFAPLDIRPDHIPAPQTKAQPTPH